MWHVHSQENWETITSDDRTEQETEVVANVKKKKRKENIKGTGRMIFFEPIAYDGWRPRVLREDKTHIYYR